MEKCKKCGCEIKEGANFCGVCGVVVKRESEYTITMKKDYFLIAGACLIYSIFYVVCLYENLMGVTFPVFTAGTVIFLWKIIKKLGMPVKKITMIYYFFMILIGVSTFLTADRFIIFFNYFGRVYE